MSGRGKKKTAARIAAGAAAAVLLTVVIECFYLPRYLFRREVFDISQKQPTETVTVMSTNVRCWSPTDLFRQSWFYRAALVVENAAAAEPDIIGFQEVTPVHYRYLCQTLQGYESVICYRDKSPLSEGCPVFYSTAAFECEDAGSFWLSETPEVMSKGWGAAFNRVCSYAILRRRSDGQPLAVFNTHLDNVSEEARINGIKLVLKKLEAFGGMPCVLMGDLKTGEDKETYRAATELFDDAKYRAPVTETGATYQGFGASPDHVNLDYFMISKTGIEPLAYDIVSTTYSGAYPSDHFPITLQFRF